MEQFAGPSPIAVMIFNCIRGDLQPALTRHIFAPVRLPWATISV